MGLKNWIYEKTGIDLKKTDTPFVYNELFYKKIYLKKASKLNILVLGSSHGAYSFIPSIVDKSCFNLCSSSQDLYYSFKLYKKFQNKFVTLKKVVLYFSVFSFGFELEKTTEKMICSYFKYLYDIKPKTDNDEINLMVDKCKRYKKPKNIFAKVDNGFLYHKNEPTDNPITENRVRTHLREKNRENNQFDYLIKLINECNKNNQELIVILPPARSDYKKLTPDNVFEKIYKLKDQYNFKLINLFNSNLFDNNDFFDCDHTNLSGAIKLSYYLKDCL